MRDYTGYKIVGLYFGYPKCCISWFVERMKRIDACENLNKTLAKSQKGFHDGFSPCPSCAEKVKPGKEHLLIENRYCEKSFTNRCLEFPDEKLQQKILKENLSFCVLG